MGGRTAARMANKADRIPVAETIVSNMASDPQGRLARGLSNPRAWRNQRSVTPRTVTDFKKLARAEAHATVRSQFKRKHSVAWALARALSRAGRT